MDRKISVRMPGYLTEALKKAAAARGIRVSTLLRLIVEQFFSR